MTGSGDIRPFTTALRDAERSMGSVIREWASHPAEFQAAVARAFPTIMPESAAEAEAAARECVYAAVALMHIARHLDTRDAT